MISAKVQFKTRPRFCTKFLHDTNFPPSLTPDFFLSQVRCVSPEPPPLDHHFPSNTLVAITYNIWERDFYISNDGQRERTCRIPRWLALEHPDVDVIGFEEAFMGGCDHTYPEVHMVI